MNEKPSFKDELISRGVGSSHIVERNGNKEIRLSGMYIFIQDVNYDSKKREQIERLSLKLNSILKKHELAKGRIENILNGNTRDSFDESLIAEKIKLPVSKVENEIIRISKELKRLGVEKITGSLKWPIEEES